MLCLFRAVQTVTPPAIPHCKLVIGHWMLPDVCTSDHAVLLALDQHQILTQHLSTTWRDMLKNSVKGGITRCVFSKNPDRSDTEPGGMMACIFCDMSI